MGIFGFEFVDYNSMLIFKFFVKNIWVMANYEANVSVITVKVLPYSFSAMHVI